MNQVKQLVGEKAKSLEYFDEYKDNKNNTKSTYLVTNLNITYSNINSVCKGLLKLNDSNIISIGNDISSTQSSSVLQSLLSNINTVLLKNRNILYLNPTINFEGRLTVGSITVEELRHMIRNFRNIKLLSDNVDTLNDKYYKNIKVWNYDMWNNGSPMKSVKRFYKFYNELQSQTVLLTNQTLATTTERYKSERIAGAAELLIAQLCNFKKCSIVIAPSLNNKVEQNGRLLHISNDDNYYNFFKINNSMIIENCLQIQKERN